MDNYVSISKVIFFELYNVFIISEINSAIQIKLFELC